MTPAIEIAEKALNVKTGLEKTANPPAANLAGRQVEHWSYKVLAAGALVGLVALVVFGILKMIPAAVVAGALLGTDLIGAFYLHRFRLYDQLEGYVKEMAGRINMFGDQVKELKQADKDLSGVDKDIAKVPANWQAQIEKGKKELLEVHQKFEKLKRDYDSVIKKLERFSTISKTLQNETGSMAQETIRFGEENKLLGDNLQKISSALEAYQKHNEEISERNKELDQANQELDRLEKEFSTSIEVIKGLFDSVKDAYEKMRELMATLDKKVKDMDTVYSDFKASNAEIPQLTQRVAALTKEIDANASDKAELKELRAFKMAKKVEFDAWKKTKPKV